MNTIVQNKQSNKYVHICMVIFLVGVVLAICLEKFIYSSLTSMNISSFLPNL